MLPCPMLPCENFLYGFKAAPRGRSRRRLGALAFAHAAAPATAGLAPVGWRESNDSWGRSQPRKFQGRSGFDKGTLAMAHIGLTGAGRSQPDSPTSVRAIAPCKIRRSVRTAALPYHPCRPNLPVGT